ncbi:PREDICTED: tRNA (adenine(58)-N(1))-methyltransferase non-catalytic subunit TRM6 [Rhagoletis zephyria]|uniref:tRNA (adenine(58)-N(1))-methyltransferase non-catalytic subunit TRM6 n=1 Tax=Rhagoletis zephyria TaxID=28612 RepID=UPI0008113741|nr:PREDICTED: tRNA (adenine(58)-N(1))-methyltransferase non-catalytic subunit TRM6 [Rhagoletis zephyria]
MTKSTAIEMPKIQLGDYIVIQRQKYTKLQKFGSLDATSMLGKEQLELRALLDQPYSATFKMCPKETTPSSQRGQRNQRLHTLELCNELELRDIRESLGISASGVDNRNIIDDGDSQALRPEDIEQLREEHSESKKIIEKIVENSKTFHSKTEYSQEKYLRKKEKKYFEFVQIRRPTLRLITEIYYRQDADKVMGMRLDTLSQLISYSGVSAYGNYLLYESGTNGLLPASFLNSIGADTEATLVHMHPGNVPQKQAMLALNLPHEQLQRCISVNLYSVLREYYQGEEQELPEAAAEPGTPAEETEPSSKKQKLCEGEEGSLTVSSTSSEGKGEITATNKSEATSTAAPVQKWQVENQRACELIRAKFDSLVIAAKEHPSNIVQALLPFVKPSRPIVLYSQSKELLMDLYVELKSCSNVTNLHLTSNWLRYYQILPNRTHPEVNMNGNSGYLLTGYTIA